MAPRPRLAFTQSAEMFWDGRLRPEFRNVVDEVFGHPIADEAWEDLQHVCRHYAINLNHEMQAGSLADQRKAAAALLKSTDELAAAIEAANSLANGQIVSVGVAAQWVERIDVEQGTEAQRRSLARAIDHRLGVDGEGVGREWVREFVAGGLFQAPSQPADFLGDLSTFRDAVFGFVLSLERGEQPVSTKGDSWIEVNGELEQWARRHNLPAWVSHSEIFNGAGPLVYLMKAINEEIPELFDADGVKASRQMRRPGIADASLAKSMGEAQRAFKASLPKEQGTDSEEK